MKEKTERRKDVPAKSHNISTKRTGARQVDEMDERFGAYFPKPSGPNTTHGKVQLSNRVADDSHNANTNDGKARALTQINGIPGSSGSRPSRFSDAERFVRQSCSPPKPDGHWKDTAAGAQPSFSEARMAEAARLFRIQMEQEEANKRAAAADGEKLRRAKETAEKQEQKRKQNAEKREQANAALVKERELTNKRAAEENAQLAGNRPAQNVTISSLALPTGHGLATPPSHSKSGHANGTVTERGRPVKAGPAKSILATLAEQTKASSAMRGVEHGFPSQQPSLAPPPALEHQESSVQGNDKLAAGQHSGLFVSDSSSSRASAPRNGLDGDEAVQRSQEAPRSRSAEQANAQGPSNSKPKAPARLAHEPITSHIHQPQGNQIIKPITQEERRLLALGVPKTPEPPLHSRFGDFPLDNSRPRAKRALQYQQPARYEKADPTPARLALPSGLLPGPRSLSSAVSNGTFKQPKPNLPFMPNTNRGWVPSIEDDAKPENTADPVSRRNNGGSTKTHDKNSTDRRLGEVSILDLKLVKWRNEDIEWSEVVRRQEVEHGLERKEDPSRRRFRQVQFAIATQEITKELCEAAIGGHPTALEEINALLRQQGLDQSTRMPTVTESRNVGRKFPKPGATPDITLADLRLCSWRDAEQLPWASVLEAFAKLTGAARGQGTLRDRYRVVTEALSIDEITPQLIMEAMKDNSEGVEALSQINQLVRQTGRRLQRTVATRHDASNKGGNGASAVKKREASVDMKPFIPVAEPSQPLSRRQTAAKRPPPGWDTPVSPESRPQSPITAHSHERRTEGGKTMSWQVYNAYLEHLDEAYNPPEDSFEEDAMPSPLSDADYMHYAYQPERRECSQQQVEEDNEDIDNFPWSACGEPFDNISRANRAAVADIMLVRPGRDSIIPGKCDTNLNTKYDKRGLVQLELKTGLGVIQMRVNRYMRTWQDHIAPTSKEGWAPKIILFVKIRVTKKPPGGPDDDDLFGEAPRPKAVDPRVVSTVFCDLKYANKRAIEEWLDETFIHRTANLDIRTIERNDAAAKLTDGMVGGLEEGRFTKRYEDGRKVVEVWVEQGELSGPRNIF